uniref:Integrase catalytic domain-containing protein n=1 Tax=Chromera velia CCMP2878 TaxID=1169474 RepID=A0A0G4IEQ5_9ALVE|eukprot:Cvel_13774.t1-p1 / transcript=Cvel_13774.t1 / gene=Cvel_13774 / organism=Chromera_velia_CCMP2878 / gene_product=hypothetical protein / transcript_product=hypothetical protein / location=Cvel_scaffold954:35888-39036(+) / protein_length=628 / sequence_SO=supercontig / SO=protein_coding / is_pseudo=false
MTTSPTTTPALHSPLEGIAGVGVSVSTGEAPEGVRVYVSSRETPEGVCMSVSPEEASVPSGEGVEGLKEPAYPGGLAGRASTTAQDSVKATTGGDVKGPVSFSIPGVFFTKGAYVGARLHLDSLYLRVSDCGSTHQLTVLEDFLPYGLAPRFATHLNSHETVAFLENVWFPRFGVPEEIRCDQGSEFANAPLIELSKRRGFRLSFAPSGYKDGNSLSERWQREVFASVCSLLLERQLPGSSWPEIHDEAIRRLNNRMLEQEAATFAPLFGPDPITESPPNTMIVPVPPIPAPLPPADLPAIYATEPPLSSQPTQQPIPESAPPATPPLASPFPVTPAPLQLGTMVIGHSPEHSLLWVGETLGVLLSDGAAQGDVWYEVHAWGSHQRCALSCRQWAPGYYSSGGGYVSYNKRASKRAVEIVELSHGQIMTAGFEMERSRGNRGSRLLPSLCSHFASGSDGCHFYEYLGARLSDPSVASTVAFLASIDLSVHVATSGTHRPEPTLFPGVWVLHRADGELRALLATYCDDLLILGIEKDAAATIDPLKDIVTCSDYTDLSEGRFVSVQFDLSTTGIFYHQHNYVASLVLPPDMAGSDRRADKPLPVGSTHEDDTSPLLFAAGVKVFRTLLG